MGLVFIHNRTFTVSATEQTGAWGCFDEFNRINIEVLSVVAQQILSILSALSTGQSKFHFDGQHIRLVWSCGIFITMNPGRANKQCSYNIGTDMLYVPLS